MQTLTIASDASAATPSTNDRVQVHDHASDELDHLTADLARRVRAGSVVEKDARMAIFEAVFRTGIVASETQRYCHRHNVARYLHDDMVEAAVDFYTRKILDLPSTEGAADSRGRNGTKFFDLEVFADGASAAGSIRQALSDYTLMHRTLLRSVRSARRVGQVVSTDLLEGTVDADGRLAGLLHELPVEPDPAAEVVDAGRAARLDHLYEVHAGAAARQRGVLRAHIDAAAVRAAFDLPELDRPVDPDVRARLLAWVDVDEMLALQSVVAILLPARASDLRAERLTRLWSAFSLEQLTELAEHEYGRRMAQLLVRDALADRARPGRPAVSRTRVAVKRAVAGRGVDASWGAELTAVFLEHEHEARSAWDPDRGVGGPTRDTGRYLRALEAAAALPGAPLGRTPVEVRDTLAGLVADARQPARQAKSV